MTAATFSRPVRGTINHPIQQTGTGQTVRSFPRSPADGQKTGHLLPAYSARALSPTRTNSAAPPGGPASHSHRAPSTEARTGWVSCWNSHSQQVAESTHQRLSSWLRMRLLKPWTIENTGD